MIATLVNFATILGRDEFFIPPNSASPGPGKQKNILNHFKTAPYSMCIHLRQLSCKFEELRLHSPPLKPLFVLNIPILIHHLKIDQFIIQMQMRKAIGRIGKESTFSLFYSS